MALGAVAGALLGAGIGAGGGLIQAGMNFASAKDAMDFQKEMYKHRYQWTMEDMRKAGLNPILAYSQGGGGVPPGATASFPNVLESAAANVKELPKREEEVALLKETTGKTRAEAYEALMRGRESGERGTLAHKQQEQVDADVALARATIANIEQQMRLAQYDENRARADSDFYGSDIGRAFRIIERITNSAGGLPKMLPRPLPPRR